MKTSKSVNIPAKRNITPNDTDIKPNKSVAKKKKLKVKTRISTKSVATVNEPKKKVRQQSKSIQTELNNTKANANSIESEHKFTQTRSDNSDIKPKKRKSIKKNGNTSALAELQRLKKEVELYKLRHRESQKMNDEILREVQVLKNELEQYKNVENEAMTLKVQLKYYQRKEEAQKIPKELWVKNEENINWKAGKVVNVVDTTWEIQYIGYSNDYNDWLEYDDPRISLTKPKAMLIINSDDGNEETNEQKYSNNNDNNSNNNTNDSNSNDSSNKNSNNNDNNELNNDNCLLFLSLMI